MHLVVKEGKKPRLTIDHRELNKLIKTTPVKRPVKKTPSRKTTKTAAKEELK